MTNGECIYRKTVVYMSRMALEKDDFRRFSRSGNFGLQEIGSRRALHQGWKWTFKHDSGIHRLKTLTLVHRSNNIS